MFKKKDFLLIGLVLLLALGIFLFQYNGAKDTHSLNRVRVTVNGAFFGEYPLNKPQDISILQDNGCENILRIEDGCFYMLRANCHNQLCIGQGEVTNENYPLRSLGTHILCLPNRVDVELLIENTGDSFMPDI